jgi:hypothetical protein
LARPYIWRFTSLSLVIWPSVWPFDQGSVMAAQTAALSLRMGQKIVYSPWIDPTVTTCKEGKPPRNIPDGKVLTRSGKLIDA